MKDSGVRGKRTGCAAFRVLATVAALLLPLSGCKEAPQKPAVPAPEGSTNAALDPQRLYMMNCGRCHLTNGEGVTSMAPPLKDDAVVTARDPGELIRVVLYGTGGKTIRGQEYPSRMPGFAESLNDEETAAVINHTRTSWGHKASTVTAADVRKERKQP